ncbi:MAG: hypothetical protein DRN40_05180, partial [Thermoplasmata archaeon]
LSWDPPPYDGGEEIISYRIYRGESESNLSLLVELLPSVYSYNDTTVKNGKTYFYRMTAVNSRYESQPSETVSATPEEKRSEEEQQEKEKKGEDHTILFVATFISLLLLLIIMYLYFKKKGGVEPPPNPPTPGYNTISSVSEQPLPGEAKKGQ